jgi:hypothetical protein
MRPQSRCLRCIVTILTVTGAVLAPALAHDHGHFTVEGVRPAATPRAHAALLGTSGQGKWKFRVLYTSDRLPEPARKVLKSAHGGFAVDRRPGRGEVYFALPGAGILVISADLKNIGLVATPPEAKDTNLHNTTVWYSEGNAYLTFPANDAGKVFTTTLDGKLLHTLEAPGAGDDFGLAAVNDYFRGGGNFAPTGVAYLDGKYFVTTGYSALDYVLTARILRLNPFQAAWFDLVFGGKGSAAGQFGTAHGITVAPGGKRLDIADRPNSEIDRFNRFGHYRGTLRLPAGSWPCDVDYLDDLAVVASLHGPDRSQGAPIYILENDRLVSTILPKAELGLENFQHIHNAVLHRVGGKLYIIAQSWNPGDFAVLEQVVE